MEPAKKRDRDWQEFWELNQLVCRTRNLRGEPKVAWSFLWWDLGFWRGNQGDVTASQVAAGIGSADAASGRRALKALITIGLLVLDKHDKLTGRYTIYMPDPRVVLRRCQASDGQGNFLDDRDEEEAATDKPESSPVAGRVGTGAHAPAGDNAPPVPTAPPGGSACTSAEVKAHLPAEAPAHPPRQEHIRRISRGGELPRVDDLKTCDLEGKNFPDIDLNRRSSIPLRSQVSSWDGASAGLSTRTEQPAADAVHAAVARLLGGPDPLAAKVEWLRDQIPGLWLEVAEWVVHEVAGLHANGANGGESPFNADELAKIVSRTRGLAERGALRKSPGVYFAGACEIRFHELRRKWTRFKPGKPR